MTDILELLAADDPPEEREVTINGQKVKVWFRHITAGQRAALYKGQTYSFEPGSEQQVNVDLGLNQLQGHMLVQFSACDESGKPLFKDLEAVQKLPDRRVQPLVDEAARVNRELDDLDLLKKR